MKSSIKNTVRQICPPVVWSALQKMKGAPTNPAVLAGTQQDLDIYWTDEMAHALDNWGTGTVWHEIVFLLANCCGRVLDIACGSGKTMTVAKQISALELYGCDISDMLIQKAIDRGIEPDRLRVSDATKMDYADDWFNYSYSIGSLEHFTSDGIDDFIAECYRVTRLSSFHMMPISRSGLDEGWMKTEQSFHNNSVGWWVARFKNRYQNVLVLDSLWNDAHSIGKWFVCSKS